MLLKSAVMGAKLMDNWQDATAAKIPAVEELAATSGHEEAPVPSSVKSVEILGLVPRPGAGKLSGALPIFSTVTVCAVVIAPILVVAKLNPWGVARFISPTKFISALEKTALPVPFYCTPETLLAPPPNGTGVWIPPESVSLTIRLLLMSAT